MLFSKDPNILRTIILENYENPRNLGKIEDKNALHIHNKSSTCIDDFHVYLLVKNKKVLDAKFCGVGCAISTASGSMLTTKIINKTLIEAKKILQNFNNMLLAKDYDERGMDELIAFHTIHLQSNRIKCAMAISQPLLNMIEEVKNA